MPNPRTDAKPRNDEKHRRPPDKFPRGRFGAVLVGASLGLACETDPSFTPRDLGPVDIGTGALNGEPGFLPFTSGEELQLAPGSQGGFHVFINLRLDSAIVDEVSDFPLIRRLGRRVDTGELVTRTVRRERLAPRGSFYETEGSLRLFLCPTPIDIEVANQAIELEVEVSPPDEGGPRATGKVRFTPICPDDEQADFCRNICFG